MCARYLFLKVNYNFSDIFGYLPSHGYDLGEVGGPSTPRVCTERMILLKYLKI